jgi:hypothetical protein
MRNPLWTIERIIVAEKGGILEAAGDEYFSGSRELNNKEPHEKNRRRQIDRRGV